MKTEITTELKEYKKPELVVLDVAETKSTTKIPIGLEFDLAGLGSIS